MFSLHRFVSLQRQIRYTSTFEKVFYAELDPGVMLEILNDLVQAKAAETAKEVEIKAAERAK
jgi:hypothetical protein